MVVRKEIDSNIQVTIPVKPRTKKALGRDMTQFEWQPFQVEYFCFGFLHTVNGRN